MRVIGYTYEAACHCVDCTLKRNQTQPFSLGGVEEYGDHKDEHGLPMAATDKEGNEIHPIFSTDDTDETCDDCLQPIE